MENTHDLRICFIGDSFVNGTGDPDKLGWSGRLVTKTETSALQITHYNLGIRRNTSRDILQRWEEECKLRLTGDFEKLLIFSFGVNDTLIENNQRRVSFTESIENTQQILTEASHLFPVKMIGPPPISDREHNQRIKQLDQALNSTCKQLDIPYLSIFQSLIDEPIWLHEVANYDGAHPRANGYALLAQFIHTWPEWLAASHRVHQQ